MNRPELPAGPFVRRTLRHDEIRARRDLRGLPDADRGGDTGADRHPRLPSGLAGDAGARHHRAGHADRRLRRHGGPRVFDQPADPVRARAGDRHRGRRRDRHRGRRRALRRAGAPRPRSGGTGDGRPDRSGARHHAGPDVGVHSRRLPAGVHGAALPAVRARHRLDRLHQRGQRPDAETDAVRPVAQGAEAGGGAQHPVARVRAGLRAWRAHTPG